MTAREVTLAQATRKLKKKIRGRKFQEIKEIELFRNENRINSVFQVRSSLSVTRLPLLLCLHLGIYRGKHLLTEPWYICTVFILAEITEVICHQ